MAALTAAESEGQLRGTQPASLSSGDGLVMGCKLHVNSSVCVFRNVIFKKHLIVLIYAARNCQQSSALPPKRNVASRFIKLLSS